MDPRSLEFVCRATHGRLLSGLPDTKILRVSTDSRRIAQGDLFFAIKGDKFDGHDFIPDVAREGATAVVVDKRRAKPMGVAVIAVDDPRAALGQMGARYRTDFDLPIIAVAGSNGKTTTKELIAAVLQQQLPVVWSEASFNNDIGVP